MRSAQVKEMLERELLQRNTVEELSYERPDPLFVARKYKDESIALICALFGYGNARLIVKFLESLDFGLLDESEETIIKAFVSHYYRFQKSEDVTALFIALKRLKESDTLEEVFFSGYKKEESLLDGLWTLITAIRSHYPHESYGYNFLVGQIPRTAASAGTYKRYLMFLRWMVRSDSLDMGLWSKLEKKALLMPLDTHTFSVSRKLGLLTRKSCDMKASIALTEKLKKFDPEDPVKYDFALYRLGQERRLLR